MKQFTFAVLTAMLLNACGNTNPTPSEPVGVISTSELIANCVEDYMDTAEYPTDMSDTEAIDYIADLAVEYCEAKYN